jgi:curved DNA-binding protein CbpA
MRLKDYYKTLNVPSNAGPLEIRKAFRRLALQFHPDKTNGDSYKEAIFREVQEAYATLSNPKSREEYNYKRWYTRSMGKSFSEQALTPVDIQREAKKLADYIDSGNDARVDHDVLSQRIRAILSANNIRILLQFREFDINHRIIRLMLNTARPLPFRYVEPILILLAELAAGNEEILRQIKLYGQERADQDYWRKRTLPLVILFTLLICWLMYLYAS